MRRTVGRRQLAVGSEGRLKSDQGFMRSGLAFVLAAFVVWASLFSSGAVRVFAQSSGTEKPKATQAEKASNQSPQTDAAQVEAERRVAAASAALVTEFDVNGLKVLVKRRAGSQTVAGGLFIRGGSRNITAANAGIEDLMLDLASEGSANFPRERLRSELARTGTVLGSSVNYDYSVLSFTSTRPNFDSAWMIFTDAALHPAFTKEDFELVKNRKLSALADEADE